VQVQCRIRINDPNFKLCDDWPSENFEVVTVYGVRQGELDLCRTKIKTNNASSFGSSQ
jgi:hypothetical protein